MVMVPSIILSKMLGIIQRVKNHLHKIQMMLMRIRGTMKDRVLKLIEEGCTIKDIHDALNQLSRDEIIKCDGCRRRLGDIEKGILVIKCRCGEYKKLII